MRKREPTFNNEHQTAKNPALFTEKGHLKEFWWWFLVLFVFSLAAVWFGFWLGSDLGSMGDVLAGTLGVAVAFAGAYVAYKIAGAANRIASSANYTLVLQERREANRTANEALEQSIGQILLVQLLCERLLRACEALAQEVDSVEPDDARIESYARLVDNQAEKLSDGITKVLTNPLALSVLFDLQAAKLRGGRLPEKREDVADSAANEKTCPQTMLENLSQLPRILDAMRLRINTNNFEKNYLKRWCSPFDLALRLHSVAKIGGVKDDELRLRIYDFFASDEDSENIKVLSYLCFLTNEYEGAPNFDIREPSLVRCFQYFLYTQDQAQDALETVFPRDIYSDEDTRQRILRSKPAKTFSLSGCISDHIATQMLFYSTRTIENLQSILRVGGSEHPVCLATFSALKIEDFGKDEADKHWGEVLVELDKERVEALAKGCRERLFPNLYQSQLLKWKGARPLEIYRSIFESYKHFSAMLKRARLQTAAEVCQMPGLVDVFTAITEHIQFAVAKRVIKEQFAEKTAGKPIGDDFLIEMEIARLCSLAAEADAITEVLALDMPQGKVEDIGTCFRSLKLQLCERIIQEVLADATEEDVALLRKALDTKPVWPRIVKLAALACQEEGKPWAFESWLQRFIGEESPEMMGLVILCEVRSLGAEAELYVTKDGSFRIQCLKIPFVHDGLASSVTFDGSSEGNNFKWEIAFRLPAGVAPDLCSIMLGYKPSNDEASDGRIFTKSYNNTVNRRERMRCAFVELDVIGRVLQQDHA